MIWSTLESLQSRSLLPIHLLGCSLLFWKSEIGYSLCFLLLGSHSRDGFAQNIINLLAGRYRDESNQFQDNGIHAVPNSN